MLRYEQKEGNSFALIETKDGSDTTSVYSMREQLTTWQAIKSAGYVGETLKNCSSAGSAIVNSLATAFTGDQSTDPEERAKGALKTMLALTGKDFGESLALGFGEVAEYVADNSIITKLMATLYLKEGETSLSKDEVTKRALQMEIVPFTVALEGLKSFFGSKMKS